jgi:hypothetical protein
MPDQTRLLVVVVIRTTNATLTRIGGLLRLLRLPRRRSRTRLLGLDLGAGNNRRAAEGANGSTMRVVTMKGRT